MNIKPIIRRIHWSEKSSPTTQIRTVNRIQTMADAIEVRFPEVREPKQIKLKHLHYLQNVWFEEHLRPATKADYVRAMRLMVEASKNGSHWLVPLKLTRDRRKGGRPRISRVTKSKSQRVNQDRRRNQPR